MSDPRQTLASRASRERWMAAGICAALVALVWLVFGQAARFEFVNYDDADNVFGDRHLTAGLEWDGIVWAFTHPQVGRWVPLTAITHMADYQFHGPRPGGHHLTNVALHAAAAVLLFLALRGMTGATWRSAFVAAVFAVHPLRAEAVAWVSARGDLLAGVFFMLVLLAYEKYARKPGSLPWYLATVAFFVLGLMCKPTIVMLPLVLLLLDYWPLDRFAKLGMGRLFAEKIPLFVLAALSCMAAALAQRGAVTPIENLSFPLRTGNALVSCAVYVWQMVYPDGLAAFYPHPGNSLPLWQVLVSSLFLAIVSAAACAARRSFRYVPVGWFWHLVMLLPVLGIVEIGEQAHADRYTYLPQIGLSLLATWGACELTAKWDSRREVLGVAGAAVIALLALRAHDQASTWQDGVTLWNSVIENTGPNSVAENNLGSVLLKKGRMDEALDHIGKALEIDPGRAEAHLSMGNLLLKSGHTGEAIAEYRRALELRRDYADAHINLGNALLEAGQPDEAIAHFQTAIDINPEIATAHNNLGEAFRRTGRPDEAIAQFQKALELDPRYDAARDNLGLALRQKGEAPRAGE